MAANQNTEGREAALEKPELDEPSSASRTLPADDDDDDGLKLCVVCFLNQNGTALQPCGHDYFCEPCSRQFRTCPLCRSHILAVGRPVRPESDLEWPPPDVPRQSPVEVLAARTLRMVFAAGCLFWLFIFFGGAVEYLHELPRGCNPFSETENLECPDNRRARYRRADIYGCLAVCRAFECDYFRYMPETEGCEIYAAEQCWASSSWRKGLYRFDEVNSTNTKCTKCSVNSTLDPLPRCEMCGEGFINGGFQCFEQPDDLPPVRTAAALGGTFYFTAIVLTQAAGCLCELVLIWRMRRLQALPGKELWILLVALVIEVLRMLLVDVFVLRDYFGGRAYQVYRAGVPCSSYSPAANLTDLAWLGADNVPYCPDPAPYSPLTQYYIARSREAYFANGESCPTYTVASALLDHGRSAGPWIFSGGAARYAHLGWVVGGEFAMFYLFATFINEVADIVFVVPSTTSTGLVCKVFAIALEFFQLGALSPAAIFVHGDCLKYLAPLGVPDTVVRGIIVAFGYCMWGLVFVSIPLAVAGAAMIFLLVVTFGFVYFALWILAQPMYAALYLEDSRCAHWLGSTRLGGAARRPLRALMRFCVRSTCFLEDSSRAWFEYLCEKLDSLTECTKKSVMTFATITFMPLLLIGMFLGLLVVIGQASKGDGTQILTALVLSSDVLFKVGATLITEAVDYALHLRVRRHVSLRREAATRRVPAQVIGQQAPASDEHPSGTAQGRPFSGV